MDVGIYIVKIETFLESIMQFRKWITRRSVTISIEFLKT